MTLPLSIFLIARNEADRLPATLAAVRGLAQEVVLVDSGSQDDTVAVAEACGARVLVNAPFPGFGPQKRFAEDACTYPWLLNIDADEVVTPALATEIKALFAAGEPSADGYAISIVDVLPGDEIPRALSYSIRAVRLYRRSSGRYSNSLVHDRVVLAPGALVQPLRGSIHHFSIQSLSQQLIKLDRYSTLQSRDFVERGRHLPVRRVFMDFPLAFLKAYLGRRLFLRGVYGFLLAMNHAIFRHLRVAKIYELQRKKAPNLDDPSDRSP